MTDVVTTAEKVEAKAIVAEATPPFSAVEAIAMIVDDYGGKWAPEAKRLDIDDVQLYLHRRVLVVRGSDGRRDWWRNLLVWPWTLAGDSGIRWAHGSLVDARVVFAWAKAIGPENIDLIIGHSRGGPIAQIVGYSLGLPVWTFASPRALYFGKPKLVAPVTNYMIANDPIRWFYPLGRHVGEVKPLPPAPGIRWAERHSGRAYLAAMTPP